MRRTPKQHPVTRIALGLILGAMPVAVPGLHAATQSDAVASDATSALDAGHGTGDEWLDTRLADIDAYQARYPAAFASELERYAAIPRDYLRGLLAQPGWAAGDAWFACFLARAIDATCRSVVRARARAGTLAPWSQVLEDIDAGPRELAQVRLALADSYRRWARPLEPDAALARALRARESHAQAADAQPAR